MTYILTNHLKVFKAFGEKVTQFDRDLPIWVFEVFFSNELKTCLPCSHDDDGFKKKLEFFSDPVMMMMGFVGEVISRMSC